MIDDRLLQAEIMDELVWTPNVDTAHIGVTVRDGVVTLSGFVSTLAEKPAAERAARRVKGVRGIAEEIEVRLPAAHQRSDEEIAERAVKLLSWDVEVPEAQTQIQVKVEKGVVTLTGFVSSHFQKQAAENDVTHLSGVTGLVNQIQVGSNVPSPYLNDLQEKIEAALRRSAQLEASQISVMHSGHKVTLQGQVRSWWELQVAETAAWSAPGVIEVDDQLIVSD
jgi:osmotically-inducible protein OsmY